MPVYTDDYCVPVTTVVLARKYESKWGRIRLGWLAGSGTTPQVGQEKREEYDAALFPDVAILLEASSANWF